MGKKPAYRGHLYQRERERRASLYPRLPSFLCFPQMCLQTFLGTQIIRICYKVILMRRIQMNSLSFNPQLLQLIVSCMCLKAAKSRVLQVSYAAAIGLHWHCWHPTSLKVSSKCSLHLHGLGMAQALYSSLFHLVPSFCFMSYFGQAPSTRG